MRLTFNTSTSRWPALALTIGLVGLTTACNRIQQPAIFGPDSVNIASIPSDWPDRYDLTPVQERVLEERGRPDTFRARWDARGRLTWGSEVWTTYRRQRVQDIVATEHRRGNPTPFEITWIYQAEDQHPRRRELEEVFRGEEVIFIDDETSEVEEVESQLGTIIDLGDPEEIRDPHDWQGHLLERWVYFHEGRVYHYLDGEIFRVERIPPTRVRVRHAI